MKAGRKPKHAFNSLKIGEKAVLTGRAKVFPHQFIYNFNKKGDGKLKIIYEGKKILAERIS